MKRFISLKIVATIIKIDLKKRQFNQTVNIFGIRLRDICI